MNDPYLILAILVGTVIGCFMGNAIGTWIGNIIWGRKDK